MSREVSFIELLIVGLVTATSGAVEIVFGIIARKDSMRVRSLALRAQGTVIRLVEISLDDGVAFAPVVRYAVGDQHFEHVSPRASWPSDYKVGQAVQVFCQPNCPSEAVMEDSLNDTGFVGFGIVSLLLGIGALWLAFLMPEA